MDALQPGQVLGSFRIVRPLGAGGMGTVYEAEHLRLPVRRALKVFSSESVHVALLRKRFLVEGKLLSSMQHPRIVRVYDLIVDDETGLAYFEMDLVCSPDGEPQTLAQAHERGVGEDEIKTWFEDVCEGLAYIHSKGVIHRDISADNILIGPDGHAVISDFGIAKIVDEEYRKKIDVTVTMVTPNGVEFRMGKERYMSPELKVKNGKASFASDVWALGVTFFWMLSGSWYDVGTRLEDSLAIFDHDWAPVIAQLCNKNPTDRLPEGGMEEILFSLRTCRSRGLLGKIGEWWAKQIALRQVVEAWWRFTFGVLSVVTFGFITAILYGGMVFRDLDFGKSFRRLTQQVSFVSVVGAILMCLAMLQWRNYGFSDWLFVSFELIVGGAFVGVVWYIVHWLVGVVGRIGRGSKAYGCFLVLIWFEVLIELGIYFVLIIILARFRFGRILSIVGLFVGCAHAVGLRILVSQNRRWAWLMYLVGAGWSCVSLINAAVSHDNFCGMRFVLMIMKSGAFSYPLAMLILPLCLSRHLRKRFDRRGIEGRADLLLRLWYGFALVVMVVTSLELI